MGDNWIIIIPEAADFVPSEAAQQKAVELLERLAPDADEIVANTTDHVEFVYCGENFERILCPACGRDVELDWWSERMNAEHEIHFPLRPLALPCCQARFTLNELTYEFPQGFAKFTVEAMNPGIPDLSAADMMEFEFVLGCKVRKILRHL